MLNYIIFVGNENKIRIIEMIKLLQSGQSTSVNDNSTKPSLNNLFDPNKLSDEEDNSWADELSHSENGDGENYDDYYGEEDEYGDESINKGQKSVSPD